jgi:hypothetical protein
MLGSDGDLIGTGFVLGAFHVLTPDHLSALGTLSVGGSWRSFSLGVRWSIGHSLGLVICAALFIFLKGELNLHDIGRFCDPIVGAFMIIIGASGIVGTMKAFRYKQTKKMLLHTSDEVVDIDRAEGQIASASPLLEPEGTVQMLDVRNPGTQRLVSVFVGLLHGLAGPGGVLGVLPAVEMQQWQSSILYLGSFVVASTISMGAFAAFYGEFTRRLGASWGAAMEVALRVFSSATSLIVGLIWMSLSFRGVDSPVGAILEGAGVA